MKIRKNFSSDSAEIVLVGDLTDATTEALSELAQDLAGRSFRSIRFDCGGIEHINSYGSARWVEFVRSFPESVSLTFERCSSVFIDYAMLMSAFVGAGRIDTFFVQTECSDCKLPSETLVSLVAVKNGASFDYGVCRKCGRKMRSVFDMTDYLDAL